jgi:hypothetical protein
MIEQKGNPLTFLAQFIASKQGKTGITVTIDVFLIPKGNLGGKSQLVTGGSTTEIGDGVYGYSLAATSTLTEGEYVGVFKTADATVDQQHIPSLWVIGRAGVEYLGSHWSR